MSSKREIDSKRKARILIIDDDKQVLDLAERLLGKVPQYDIDTLSSPENVVSFAKCLMPHLIVLDINMPEMSGFDVLKAIRADEEISSIAVVMFTGVEEVEAVKEAIALGANGYLVKPIDRVEFPKKISNFLNRFGPRSVRFDLDSHDSEGFVSLPINLDELESNAVTIKTNIPLEIGTPLRLTGSLFTTLRVSPISVRVLEMEQVGRSDFRYFCRIEMPSSSSKIIETWLRKHGSLRGLD